MSIGLLNGDIKNTIMIQEDYVSFEIAKLLKEKGFNGICSFAWRFVANSPRNKGHWELYGNHTLFDENSIYCPTLQMAIKWLREVHKIGIFPSTYTTIKGSNITHTYGTVIINLNTYELMTLDSMNRETYEDACEAAIGYCLKNLI